MSQNKQNLHTDNLSITSITDTSDELNYSSSSENNFLEPLIQEPNTGYDVMLARWAIRHNITHLALDLLKLHKMYKFPQFQDLPITAKTLLKTPTTTLVKDIKGGLNYHF